MGATKKKRTATARTTPRTGTAGTTAIARARALAPTPTAESSLDPVTIISAILAEVVRLSTATALILHATRRMDPRGLLALERLVSHARAILTLAGGEVKPSFGCAGPINIGYGTPLSPVYSTSDSPSASVSANYSADFPPTPAAQGPAENFGTSAIRELISSLNQPRRQRTAEETVDAIAAARRANLDDVAARLEADLHLPAALPAVTKESP